jgi:hypothetical protein
MPENLTDAGIRPSGSLGPAPAQRSSRMAAKGIRFLAE